MLPLESTLIGVTTSRFARAPPSSPGNGLMRVPTPVFLFTRHTEPPLPGTYSEPLASAGWNTPSQFVLSCPAAVQSLVNCHCTLSWVCVPFQRYLVSPHVCD